MFKIIKQCHFFPFFLINSFETQCIGHTQFCAARELKANLLNVLYINTQQIVEEGVGKGGREGDKN